MSEAVFANLPRFDASNDPLVSGRLGLLMGTAAVEETVTSQPRGDVAEPSGLPEEAMPGIAADADPASELSAVEATMAALSDTIDRLEREAREQTVDAIQSLASRLFPELSKLFLAEEIGQHLPGLVPVSVPAIEIRAEPALAEQLRQVVGRTATLQARCTFMPPETPCGNRVDISWQTGGLNFDFDGLLQACLTKLESTTTQ